MPGCAMHCSSTPSMTAPGHALARRRPSSSSAAPATLWGRRRPAPRPPRSCAAAQPTTPSVTSPFPGCSANRAASDALVADRPAGRSMPEAIKAGRSPAPARSVSVSPSYPCTCATDNVGCAVPDGLNIAGYRAQRPGHGLDAVEDRHARGRGGGPRDLGFGPARARSTRTFARCHPRRAAPRPPRTEKPTAGR